MQNCPNNIYLSYWTYYEKRKFCVIGALLVSFSVGLTAQERINAEELKEISSERKVVTIISDNGKKLEGKIIEYNGESVLFQRQQDLQLFRFKLNCIGIAITTNDS